MARVCAEDINNLNGGKDRKETTMKKRHDVFWGFAVLLITAIFTSAGCGGGGSDSDPELAKWNGTWNSITEYFDETAVTTTITTGAEQLRNKWGNEFAALTGENLKYLFTLALQTQGFKSLKVEGDTITFYPNVNADGTVIDSIIYTLREKESDDGATIYAFDGNKAGAYQYIRLVEPETEPSDGALCFHIQYTDDHANFAALFFWPVVVKTGTTVNQITKTLEGVIGEYLNAEGEELAYYQQMIKQLLAQQSELAKWNGTWNSVHDYLDDPGLDEAFQAAYDALPDAYKEVYTSVQALRDMTKALAVTDFGSFVIQGDKIIFYDPKQTQKNPSGNVIETVTYTFKGIRQVTWQGEEADFYAFEGDKAGAHKYLIFEEAGRDTPDGPLHFHIRYGSESVDDLLENSSWAPTIVNYDTTIDELKVFMSGD